jgi:UDP-N-acetylmuramate--alanine ligase
MTQSPPAPQITIADLRGKRLHFMGIGGSGITSVVQMALLEGAHCTGCEQTLSSNAEWIAQKGVPVVEGHSPSHLDEGVDYLIIVPAVMKLDANNPEVAEAKRRGIPVIDWQAVLGAFMAGKFGISVAGVHGKGTVTSMISQILVDAGRDPTCEVGAIVPRWQGNVRMGGSELFVNEADEFNRNFLHYHPRLAVITSIEFEHPEFFNNYDELKVAFDDFVAGMEMQGPWTMPPTLVLNWDSPGCQELRQRMGAWSGQVITYALDGAADYQGDDVRLAGETSFHARDAQGNDLGRFTLPLPGRYNVENALGAIAATRELGVDVESIRQTLARFTGIYRRFQVTHAANDVIIVDDYAHHPTAIAVTLEAVRQRFPDRRLIATFQPHMFTRLVTFLEDFSHVFGLADDVVIVDVFPARERDTGLIHARDLVAAIQRDRHFTDRPERVHYGGSLEQTRALLATLAQPGDVLAMLGSGSVYEISGALLRSPTFAGYDPAGQIDH